MNINKQDKIDQIINLMVDRDKIPIIGSFDITEKHLSDYMQIYEELFGNKGAGYKTVSNTRFARKLAGITLLNLKFKRGFGCHSCKEGLVYLVQNPAWPDHLKVGMTTDLDARLSVYQTYDPYRSYKVKHYEFVFDRRLVEKNILNRYNVNVEKGEWLNKVDALEIIKNFYC